MGSNYQCSQCFVYYTLSGSVCSLDLSCNRTLSCMGCPYGYFLTNSSCIVCPLLANCLTCNTNNGCAFCLKGYYLSQAVCLSCGSSCKDCLSPSYCTQAADGYFISINSDGSSSGRVLACISPCLTCVYSADYCLACIAGYSISGSICFSTAMLLVQMNLGPAN
jgi:hypothetical protein